MKKRIKAREAAKKKAEKVRPISLSLSCLTRSLIRVHRSRSRPLLLPLNLPSKLAPLKLRRNFPLT
jgi:hypothetical protein